MGSSASNMNLGGNYENNSTVNSYTEIDDFDPKFKEFSAFSKPEVAKAFETISEVFSKTFTPDWFKKLEEPYKIIRKILIENSSVWNEIESIEDFEYLLENDELRYMGANPSSKYQVTKIQFLYLKSFAYLTNMFKFQSFPWKDSNQNNILEMFMTLIKRYKEN